MKVKITARLISTYVVEREVDKLDDFYELQRSIYGMSEDALLEMKDVQVGLSTDYKAEKLSA